MDDIEDKMIFESLKLKQIEKKINGQSWTESMEKILKQCGEKASGNKCMHLKECRKWKHISNQSNTFIIILTTLCGMVTLSNTSSIFLKYVIGSLNFTCGIMTSITRFYKPDKKVETHLQSSKQYGCLYRRIDLELKLPREDRTNAERLSETLIKQYDDIQNESPLISDKTVMWFKKQLPIPEGNITRPDIIYPTGICIEVNTS